MNDEHFDKHQFAGWHRAQQPIHAELNGDGGFNTPGISFEDYARMQTCVKNKATGARQREAPLYARNDTEFRRVLLAYLETRAFSKKQREFLAEVDEPASPIQKMNRVCRVLAAKNTRLLEVLTVLSKEYVSLKNLHTEHPYRATRLKTLECEIQTTEQTMRMNRNPAAIVAGVIYLAYRVGLDSVGVGSELGLKPQHVRQLLYRVSVVWENINSEKIERRKGKPTTERRCEVCGVMLPTTRKRICFKDACATAWNSQRMHGKNANRKRLLKAQGA